MPLQPTLFDSYPYFMQSVTAFLAQTVCILFIGPGSRCVIKRYKNAISAIWLMLIWLFMASTKIMQVLPQEKYQ